MNFMIISILLFALASATQGIAINKMQNALTSHNSYRNRNNNHVPSYKQQLYGFQIDNAKSPEEMMQLMKQFSESRIQKHIRSNTGKQFRRAMFHKNRDFMGFPGFY